MYSTSPIRVRQKFVESTSENQVLVEFNGQAYPRRGGSCSSPDDALIELESWGVGWACGTNSRYLASMDLPERWALDHGPASDAAAMSPRPDAQERPLQGKSNDRNGLQSKRVIPYFCAKDKTKIYRSALQQYQMVVPPQPGSVASQLGVVATATAARFNLLRKLANAAT